MQPLPIMAAILTCSLLIAPLTRADEADRDVIAKLQAKVESQRRLIESLDARIQQLEKIVKNLGLDHLAQVAEETKDQQPVAPSGRPVTPETTLQVGGRVLVEWSDSWWNGQIREILPSGNVRIHYEGWGDEWDEIVPRTRLQLR